MPDSSHLFNVYACSHFRGAPTSRSMNNVVKWRSRFQEAVKRDDNIMKSCSKVFETLPETTACDDAPASSFTEYHVSTDYIVVNSLYGVKPHWYFP